MKLKVNSIKFLKFRLGVRKALLTSSLEQVMITKEEAERELKRRHNKK